MYTPSISANPVDGQVAAGSATITNPSANTVQINQSSQKVIINWRGFNIGVQESTHFQQPILRKVFLITAAQQILILPQVITLMQV